MGSTPKMRYTAALFSERVALAVVFVTCIACGSWGQTARRGGASAHSMLNPGSEHFVLDHNRVFVELAFVRADGTRRKVLAFVDSGDPTFTLSVGLVKELRVDKWKSLDGHVLFGGRPLDTSAVKAVDRANWFFPGLHVEANLPATVLEQYDVVLDYAKQTLTLAPPGSVKHEGVRVPCKVNRTTGLAAVQAEVDGKEYAFTVDNGSAYTWVDQGVVKSWVSAHPQWLRGIGAVGDANMNGELPELTGMIVRLHEIGLDGLKLREVGALGVGPGWDKATPNFFAWYSTKTPGPVVGFFGGSVLRSFRLEIDYAGGATYWLQEIPLDPHDLDQVGVIIRPVANGDFVVYGVATQNGRKTVDGVEAKDRLIAVDGVPMAGATQGTVLRALHGKPGEIRELKLERGGKTFEVKARVMQF